MYLIDMEGTIAREWTAQTAVQLLKLQPDGHLYYMTRDRSNIDEAGLYKIAPDSSVLWHYHCRIGDQISTQTRRYISSAGCDVRSMLGAVRSHWGTENGLHRVLDIALR